MKILTLRYTKKRFSGAEILPVNLMAMASRRELLDEGVDEVICFTHQCISSDRQLAKLGKHHLTRFFCPSAFQLKITEFDFRKYK